MHASCIVLHFNHSYFTVLIISQTEQYCYQGRSYYVPVGREGGGGVEQKFPNDEKTIPNS